MKITDWQNCYDLGWSDLLIPEAYSHPAKFSRGLIFRIVEYLLKSEMVKPGDTVIDPFGGVALGGLPCLLSGLNWIGNELEEKFVELGRKNIELWHTKFSGMPRWTGSATLLQGDSRKLASVIAQAGGLVSSPPFLDNNVNIGGVGNTPGMRQQIHNSTKRDNSYGTTPGQLASLPEGSLKMLEIDCSTWSSADEGKPVIVASPPYAGSEGSPSGGRLMKLSGGTLSSLAQKQYGMTAKYGTTPGQLGAMPEGSAVISSPPFAGNSGGRGEASRNGIDPALFDRHQGAMVGGIGSAGNLAGMKPGALVTSPPFQQSDMRNGGSDLLEKNSLRRGRNPYLPGTISNITTTPYGTTDGQLGQAESETFWSAAKTILDQCYQLLPPGAPAVWVLKSFVRDGAIVDFPGQWQQLCESCGFETVEVIRAWLVKDKGTQVGLNGEQVKKTVARKSFFRRLAEAKGSPAIDFETVLITRKAAQ